MYFMQSGQEMYRAYFTSCGAHMGPGRGCKEKKKITATDSLHTNLSKQIKHLLLANKSYTCKLHTHTHS